MECGIYGIKVIKANFRENRAGLLTNLIFEFIFSAQVYSLWYGSARSICTPDLG